MNNLSSNTNAQNFGAFVGEAITSFINADTNRDGKLQGSEIAATALAVLIAGVRVFDTFDEAIAELRNNGSPARVALIAGLKAKFDLRDDELEFLIEDTIAYVEEGVALVERWVTFRQPTEPQPTLDTPQV
jgi:hypothetical protein